MCTHARRLMATGTCAGATLGVLKYSYWTEEVWVEDDVLYLKGRGKTGPKGNFFLHQGRDTGKTGKGKSKAK